MNAQEQTTPKDNGAESREEILRAAAEIFMEYGYAATSIDAVAERLGATKGRIYHHYPSKADLFFEVQIAAMKRINQEVEPIARGPGSPAERLAGMALRHMQVLLTELPMQKVAVQGLERYLLGKTNTVKRLRSVVQMRDDYENIFAEVIDEGIRLGQFVDIPPKLATKPFFGALNWATVWYSPRRLQNVQTVQEIAQTIADFALRGLLKDAVHATVSSKTIPS